MRTNSISIGDITRAETLQQLLPLFCKGRGVWGVMGNDALRVAVVDVPLLRAQVGARRGTEAILLHCQYYSAYKNIQ